MPKRLSEAQVAQYREIGFTWPVPVLSADEVARFCAVTEALLAGAAGVEGVDAEAAGSGVEGQREGRTRRREEGGTGRGCQLGAEGASWAGLLAIMRVHLTRRWACRASSW